MTVDLSDKSILVPKVKPLPENPSATTLVDLLLQAQGWRTCAFATAEQGQAWYARWEELRALIIGRLENK